MAEGKAENKEGGKPLVMEAHSELKGSEPSYWPITLSIGLTLAAIGLVSHALVTAAGIVVMAVALVGWAWQPWGE